MKQFLSTIFQQVASWWRQDLTEFSTSMDFDEFEVVLSELSSWDGDIEMVLRRILNEFQSDTEIGETDTWKFTGIPGRVVLEREDEYAFSIWFYAPKYQTSRLSEAFDRASEKLGI